MKARIFNLLSMPALAIAVSLVMLSPQFIDPDGSRLQAPDGDFAADALASTLPHALNVIITNLRGAAWSDKYRLENAAKCQGTFDDTNTNNGATPNTQLGARHFLIQQNWINVLKGYSGLSLPLP